MAKPQSAGARIRADGRKLIWVTADPEQLKKIRTASAIAGVPMSQFLLATGLAEAEKILAKFRKNP